MRVTIKSDTIDKHCEFIKKHTKKATITKAVSEAIEFYYKHLKNEAIQSKKNEIILKKLELEDLEK